jgi:hypothetical protein
MRLERRDSKVVQRVAIPDVQPFVTDGETMGDKYLGKERGAKLRWWFRGRRGKTFLFFNIISQILAALGIFRVIDERFCYFVAVSTIPLVAITISTSSAALFPRVVMAFDTVILLSTGLFAFGMMVSSSPLHSLPAPRLPPPPVDPPPTITQGLCLQDHRIAGVVGGFMGFMLIGISDAFPHRIRKVGTRGAGTALFIILSLILTAVLTDTIPDWTDVTISFAGLEYSSS